MTVRHEWLQIPEVGQLSVFHLEGEPKGLFFERKEVMQLVGLGASTGTFHPFEYKFPLNERFRVAGQVYLTVPALLPVLRKLEKNSKKEGPTLGLLANWLEENLPDATTVTEGAVQIAKQVLAHRCHLAKRKAEHFSQAFLGSSTKKAKPSLVEDMESEEEDSIDSEPKPSPSDDEMKPSHSSVEEAQPPRHGFLSRTSQVDVFGCPGLFHALQLRFENQYWNEFLKPTVIGFRNRMQSEPRWWDPFVKYHGPLVPLDDVERRHANWQEEAIVARDWEDLVEPGSGLLAKFIVPRTSSSKETEKVEIPSHSWEDRIELVHYATQRLMWDDAALSPHLAAYQLLASQTLWLNGEKAVCLIPRLALTLPQPTKQKECRAKIGQAWQRAEEILRGECVRCWNEFRDQFRKSKGGEFEQRFGILRSKAPSIRLELLVNLEEGLLAKCEQVEDGTTEAYEILEYQMEKHLERNSYVNLLKLLSA